MFKNADVGHVLPNGHPRMYVQPMAGECQGLMRVLEGKLAKLTQGVLTIRIEHNPAVM